MNVNHDMFIVEQVKHVWVRNYHVHEHALNIQHDEQVHILILELYVLGLEQLEHYDCVNMCVMSTILEIVVILKLLIVHDLILLIM